MAQREHRGGVLVVGGGYAGVHAVRAAEQLGVGVGAVVAMYDGAVEMVDGRRIEAAAPLCPRTDPLTYPVAQRTRPARRDHDLTTEHENRRTPCHRTHRR